MLKFLTVAISGMLYASVGFQASRATFQVQQYIPTSLTHPEILYFKF
jgi:hypothetical protein